MTALLVVENWALSSPEENAGLTAIRGISPTRASRLRESGVVDLQDIARVSDEKAESIAEEIKGVSASMIAKWRAEARKRLSVQHVEQAPSARTTADPPAGEEEWRSIASFSVAFQSRHIDGQAEQRRVQIAHREGNGPEFFEDVENDKPWRWMLAHLGEKAQPEAALEKQPVLEAHPATALQDPEPAAKVEVEILQVRAFQPPAAETPTGTIKPGEVFHGQIRAYEPFVLETSFTLAGPGAIRAIRGRHAYRAQLYARNLSTGAKMLVGDTGFQDLAEDQARYTATLPEATLPPGSYCLWIVAMLQGVRGMPGYLEVSPVEIV